MTNPERLVFDSFFHSQGDIGLQRGIFKYLEQQGVIDELECLRLIRPVMERALTYTNGHSHIQTEINSVESEVQGVGSSTAYYGVDGEQLIADIGTNIIDRDHKFVAVADTPRPSRPVYKGRKSPAHFLLFGVLELPTGQEEYDVMYRDIASRQLSKDSTDALKVEYSAQVHALLNPDDRSEIEAYLGYGLADIGIDLERFLENREALGKLSDSS